METETDRLIVEQFNKLPSNLQKAIRETPWKPLVQEIGKVNALDPSQIASLEQEVMLVLYGFEDPRDLIQNLEDNVGSDKQLSETIATDIATKIFRKIDEIASKPVANLPEIPPEDLPAVIVDSKQQLVDRSVETKKPEIPANLPTDSNVPIFKQNNEYGIRNKEETKPEPAKTPAPTHYPPGLDPYREPIE